MARSINAAGLALVKSFESFRAEPYQDDAGVWTIGYGCTHDVGPDTEAVTEEEATQDLLEDIGDACNSVSKYIRVALSENEFSALASLVYNVGDGPLTGGLGKVLNLRDYISAACHFMLWNKIHVNGKLVESRGLTRRRQAERDLFLTPDNPSTPN